MHDAPYSRGFTSHSPDNLAAKTLYASVESGFTQSLALSILES
jgi:hypothetical protein